MPHIYNRWFIFPCNSLSMYPDVHFLSMWLRGIKAIMNSNGDCAFPWNIRLWTFASAKLLPTTVYSTFQVFWIKFMTSSDILYILKQFIIQLCGSISDAFLLSIQAIARFFRLVLLSCRMCWSMQSNSAVPLDPLRHS